VSENSRLCVKGMFGFDAVVQRTPVEAWGSKTACEGWVASDVVNHLAAMCSMLTAMSQGVPAVVLGSEGLAAPGMPDHVFHGEWGEMLQEPTITSGVDVAAAWTGFRDGLLETLDDPAALGHEVLSPWGPTTTDGFALSAACDAAVHTWDLATAVGLEPVVDEELAAAALARFQASESAGAPLRQSVVMSDEVTVRDGGALTRLIGFTGRDPAFGR